jgi:uncharacterized protein YkwD
MKAKKFMDRLISKMILGALLLGCLFHGPQKYIKAASQEQKTSGMNWNMEEKDLHQENGRQNDNTQDPSRIQEPEGRSDEPDTVDTLAAEENHSIDEETVVTLNMGNGKTQTVNGKYSRKMAYQVYKMVNKLRADQGESKLKWNGDVAGKARCRAGEISVLFDHTRPDGSNATSMDHSIFGENIAMGYESAKDVMQGWTNSPGHYANMTNRNYDGMSVGCFLRKEGNSYVTCWVQLFTIES